MTRSALTLPRLVVGAALAVLAVQLGLAYAPAGRLAAAALRFPYPLAYSEGPTLDQAVRLARFENTYLPSFDAPPFTLATAPPLYPLVLAPFVRLLGPAYGYGRLLALVGAAAAAACLGLLLQTLTGDVIAAAAGGLTFLAFPQTLHAGLLAQGDTLALALSLAGLLLIVRGPASRPRAVSLWLGALLLIAAVFTRQGYALAAPLAALVWLWGRGQRRAAATLAALVFGGTLGLGLALNAATAGGFGRHLAFATFGAPAPEAVVAQWVSLYLNAGYLLIACLIFAIVEPLSERGRAYPLVLAYLAGAALATGAASQLDGGDHGRLSLAAALCLGAGGLLAWTGERYWLRAALLLVLALQVNQLTQWAAGDQIPLLMQKLSQARATSELADIVRQAPGPVLADEFNGLLPLLGRRLEFQPLEFRYLAAAGQWDEAPLRAAIARQSFAAILLYQPRLGPGLAERWTPALRDAIYQHYETRQTLAGTLIYVPRAGAAP